MQIKKLIKKIKMGAAISHLIRICHSTYWSINTVKFSLCFLLAFPKYLNGKLKSNTDYAVFQRSFDEDGGYENQGFTQFTTKLFQSSGNESSNLKTGSKFLTGNTILIGVVLIVLLIVAATCLVCRRRFHRNGKLR